MKSTVVVDANVILRYLLADHEQQHLSARTAFDEVRGGHRLAFVGEGVVVECVYVLLKVYGVGRAEIADKLLGLLALKGIRAHDLEATMDALRAFRDRNVDIVDAMVAATAKHRGWGVFSFDHDLGKLLT